jgi:hypothetical protein
VRTVLPVDFKDSLARLPTTKDARIIHTPARIPSNFLRTRPARTRIRPAHQRIQTFYPRILR